MLGGCKNITDAQFAPGTPQISRRTPIGIGMHLEGTEQPHFYGQNIYGPVTDPPLNSSAPHLILHPLSIIMIAPQQFAQCGHYAPHGD